MSKFNLRINRLEDIYARNKERADALVREILKALPRDVKETAFDALVAKRRREKLTADQKRAWAQVKAAGLLDASKKTEPYATDIEKACSRELVEKLDAGEDWRELTLSTRRRN